MFFHKRQCKSLVFVENTPAVCIVQVLAGQCVQTHGCRCLGGALLSLFSFALLSSSFQTFLCETLVELQANKLVVLVRHAGTSVVGYLFINLPSLL